MFPTICEYLLRLVCRYLYAIKFGLASGSHPIFHNLQSPVQALSLKCGIGTPAETAVTCMKGPTSRPLERPTSRPLERQGH